MSNDRIEEHVLEDIEYFIANFCTFHKAHPDENQHILRHITEQIKKFDQHKTDFVQGERGQEPIWVFERKKLRVFKRIFHPGYGERKTGADFVLYKNLSSSSDIGVTAVQVKRNGKRPYFEFDERSLNQFTTFADNWRSAYYLMVDETNHPPLDCFIAVSELYTLLRQINGDPPIRIPNEDIRKYCRGANLFYNLFYSCNRGSKYKPSIYIDSIFEYISLTKKIVIEISTQKLKNKK